MDFTGTRSECDICHINKSQQKAHPNKTVQETTGPVELVYTDRMGPIKPAAKGGYVYVSMFTDDFRMKGIFLLKSKDQAVDSLRLYSQIVAAPLGLRIQRVRTDKGQPSEQSTPQVFYKGFEIIPASPWISQRLRLHNKLECRKETDVRSLPSQGAYSRTAISSKTCRAKFAAVYIFNRSPHAARHSATPYFKMHGKEAAMTGLRAIGARAFVHVENHTTKMEDKAGEGKLCGFSPNSRSYRIYKYRKGDRRGKPERHVHRNSARSSANARRGTP